MKVIFGSGIVGLLAKEFLPGDWTILPFKRSRFYSFQPPLGDNSFIRDERIDDAIRRFGGQISSLFYRRAYSVNGELMSMHSNAICEQWLYKLFGQHVPPQSMAYWSRQLVKPIYDLRINSVYQSLQSKYHDYLLSQSKLGEVTEIGDHYCIVGGTRLDFEAAVSTVQLTQLLRLMGKSSDSLESINVSYVHLMSSSIDLEGFNQALVADPAIPFFKVINVAKQRYVFCFVGDIANPGKILMPIIGNADIIDGTMIQNAIAAGDRPQLKFIESHGIQCVGSMAQWDWCMDISSCLLRILGF